MSNIEITNNRPTGIAIWEPLYRDATLTFDGAETWPAGAVLGRLTATGAYVRFNPSGTPLIPKAILSHDVTAAGAGDVPSSLLIAGRVRAEDLVNNVGAALTDAELDELRNYSIIALSTTQLAELDNQ
jgi:hypothetical protein